MNTLTTICAVILFSPLVGFLLWQVVGPIVGMWRAGHRWIATGMAVYVIALFGFVVGMLFT